jgi:hypothetical protein
MKSKKRSTRRQILDNRTIDFRSARKERGGYKGIREKYFDPWLAKKLARDALASHE